MKFEPWLLDALACPTDQGPLLYFDAEATLYNPRLRRKYRFGDGVPQLLEREALVVSPEEHQRLLELAQQRGLSVGTLSR